ncbi:MAG: c-type cytochrome [Opitutaceae bacterium]
MKFLKFLGYTVLALVAIVAALVLVVYLRSNSKLNRIHIVTVQSPLLPTDAGAIARGRHLAVTRGCMECHGKDLGGHKVVDDPAMGRLYAPNLTAGRGGLSAIFRDEDWVKAIRHGVAPDGRGLFLMPSTDYSHFTESDMGDLVVFLKSLKPVDRDNLPLSVGPVARALMVAGKIKLAADEIDHVNLRPTIVTPGITVEYGRYVAVGCTGCHGSNYSGGKIDIGPPNWPRAANLTPDSSGRLSKWSEDDFLRTVRTGKRPDGTELSPVMPRAFGLMNDTELKAVWLYLKTLPSVATGVR